MPASFVDNMNQSWELRLSVTRVRMLAETLGHDLLTPQGLIAVSSSLTERLTFVFLLCEEQANKYEVDADEFEERLHGDGFANAASMALLKEAKQLYERLGERHLTRLMGMQIESITNAQEAVDEMIDSGSFDEAIANAHGQINKLMGDDHDGE